MRRGAVVPGTGYIYSGRRRDPRGPWLDDVAALFGAWGARRMAGRRFCSVLASWHYGAVESCHVEESRSMLCPDRKRKLLICYHSRDWKAGNIRAISGERANLL